MRDGAAAIKKLAASKSATVVLLDPGGKVMDSETFAHWIREQRDRGTREMILRSVVMRTDFQSWYGNR